METHKLKIEKFKIGNWSRTCPFEDCHEYGITSTQKKVISHLARKHFEDEVLEEFNDDVQKKKCSECGYSGNFRGILDHIVSLHEGLRIALGNRRYSDLLLKTEIDKNNNPIE